MDFIAMPASIRFVHHAPCWRCTYAPLVVGQHGPHHRTATTSADQFGGIILGP
jgi:hypothetical protein